MPQRRRTVLPKKHIAFVAQEVTSLRLSIEIVDVLHRDCEQLAKDIAAHAAELALHAGRRTVLGSDVILASKNRMSRPKA